VERWPLTARVANIRCFVCGIATSRNALQHLSCLHSPTLITYTCAELNILDWWRHAASETNYWTTKYTTCLRILSKYLCKRFGRAKRSENVSEMPIVLWNCRLEQWKRTEPKEYDISASAHIFI
jgi:hypothetical protein